MLDYRWKHIVFDFYVTAASVMLWPLTNDLFVCVCLRVLCTLKISWENTSLILTKLGRIIPWEMDFHSCSKIWFPFIPKVAMATNRFILNYIEKIWKLHYHKVLSKDISLVHCLMDLYQRCQRWRAYQFQKH